MDVTDIYHDGWHYDLMFGGYAGGSDLEFYADQARQCGGDVLELGCGTGRLTIPLALRGLNVTGLDLSPAMLGRARIKADESGARVAWVQADCRDFAMGRTFGLIFFPANSFQSLLDRDDQERCLACVREHLADGGRFALEVYNPSLRLLMRDADARFPITQYTDPNSGEAVTVTESVVYDSASQVSRATWYYQADGADAPRVAALDLRVLFPQELDALLHYNGFVLDAKYGDFDRSAFCTSSLRQIVICRARR